MCTLPSEQEVDATKIDDSADEESMCVFLVFLYQYLSGILAESKWNNLLWMFLLQIICDSLKAGPFACGSRYVQSADTNGVRTHTQICIYSASNLFHAS